MTMSKISFSWSACNRLLNPTLRALHQEHKRLDNEIALIGLKIRNMNQQCWALKLWSSSSLTSLEKRKASLSYKRTLLHNQITHLTQRQSWQIKVAALSFGMLTLGIVSYRLFASHRHSAIAHTIATQGLSSLLEQHGILSGTSTDELGSKAAFCVSIGQQLANLPVSAEKRTALHRLATECITEQNLAETELAMKTAREQVEVLLVQKNRGQNRTSQLEAKLSILTNRSLASCLQEMPHEEEKGPLSDETAQARKSCNQSLVQTQQDLQKTNHRLVAAKQTLAVQTRKERQANSQLSQLEQRFKQITQAVTYLQLLYNNSK